MILRIHFLTDGQIYHICGIITIPDNLVYRLIQILIKSDTDFSFELYIDNFLEKIMTMSSMLQYPNLIKEKMMFFEEFEAVICQLTVF